MLTLANLVALIPLIVVGTTAVIVMLGVAWQRHHGATALVSAVGLVLALSLIHI